MSSFRDSSFCDSSFCDSDKFMFVLSTDGHLLPVHYRELGEKNANLYTKNVSWADVAINNVQLEQTFFYEDEISHILHTNQHTTNEVRVNTLINERHNIQLPVKECTYQKTQKWMNRLEKMDKQTMTLPQAKRRKKGPTRYTVKPKTDVQISKDHRSNYIFNELIDTNE